MMNDKKIELTQEELDAKVAEATKELKVQVTSLIGEKRKATDKLKQFEGIDADEVKAALERAKQSERESLEKAGEYQKALDLQKSQHQKEMEKLQAQTDSDQAFIKKLLVDQGLTNALVKSGVAPQYLDATKALFSGQVSIIGEGDERKAVIGEKPLSDAVTEWSETDQGKHFVAADQNSGGGGGGGKKASSGYDGPNPWSTKSSNLTERSKIRKENPELADKLKKEAEAESASDQ